MSSALKDGQVAWKVGECPCSFLFGASFEGAVG